MEDKKIYHDELLKSGEIPWTSWKTTKRKIESEGFPAHYDGGRWCFVIREIRIWWKKRNVTAA